MSKHILTVRADQRYADLYPNKGIKYVGSLKCPEGNNCTGFTECDEIHEHEGVRIGDHEAGDCCPGDPSMDPPELCSPWCGEEEFEFHGEWHTYQDGYGWTVPFEGCIVNEYSWEIPDECYPLRPSVWTVDVRFDDEWIEFYSVKEIQYAEIQEV